MRKETFENLPTDLLIDGDAENNEVHIDGKFLSPKRSQSIRNHSPDGFNWGYCGSGPAQLALAICLNFMAEKDASAIYQHFKFSVVAGWPQGKDFEIKLNFKEAIGKIITEHKIELS